MRARRRYCRRCWRAPTSCCMPLAGSKAASPRPMRNSYSTSISLAQCTCSPKASTLATMARRWRPSIRSSRVGISWAAPTPRRTSRLPFIAPISLTTIRSSNGGRKAPRMPPPAPTRYGSRCWPSTKRRPSTKGRTKRSANSSTSAKPRCRTRITRSDRLLRRIPLPEPFERRGQRLRHCRLINMLRIAGEQELVVVALVREHLGETFVRQNPVVHAICDRRSGVEEILVSGLEPDANWLRRAVGDQGRAEMRIALRNFAALDAKVGDSRSRPRAVIFPGAARQGRVMRPLLVHNRRRIREHPVIKFGMEPGHRKGRRSARADAHCRPAVRILGELDVGTALDQRQHFILDELRISSRDRVVLEPPFAPLGVLPARSDKNGGHRRCAMLTDQIVKNREQLFFVIKAVGTSVAKDDERSFASRDVARRNIDVDGPGPDSRMGGWNQKVRLVAGRRLPAVDRRIEAAVRIIPDHAGTEDRAIIRRHGEGINLACGRAVLSGKPWGGGVGRPDDEIAFRLARRKRSVWQLSRLRIVGILRVARRGQGFEVEARRVDVERLRRIGRIGTWRNGGVSFQAVRVRCARNHEASDSRDPQRVHHWRSPLIVVLS